MITRITGERAAVAILAWTALCSAVINFLLPLP
jgi:hypothetical protein